MIRAIKKSAHEAATPSGGKNKISYIQYIRKEMICQMSVKINALEIENVKRIRAVRLEPSANGLTVIGGKNNQGKTSVLDSIAWALGGDKYRPSSPGREGSVIPPHLKVRLSNGMIAERSGKNSSLKVTDPEGKKSGQQLLNEFISQFAIDLPKFMDATPKEKAQTLLELLGIGDQLYTLDAKEESLYSKRHAIGQIAEQKKAYAEELPSFDNVPDSPISASELIKQQQDILARNGENARKRRFCAECDRELEEAQNAFDAAVKRFENAKRNADDAHKSAEDLVDESTAELEENISRIDILNDMIRKNLEKSRAADEAVQYRAQYQDLTAQIEHIRNQRNALLDGARMPLPGLTVENGELVYHGVKWDCMSGSDQLKVSTAIVKGLNPNCGFVLLDKLEQMDTDTLAEFSAWLEQNDLQAIATRVSVGDECSIIIEDGYAVPDLNADIQNAGGKF